MASDRSYHHYTYRAASFRICSEHLNAVTGEIGRQRDILEAYVKRQPDFLTSLNPLSLLPDVPEVARRMAHAARLAEVGPMAAVAGTMAQLAAEAGLRAGDSEIIVDNGGDIYLKAETSVTIGLHSVRSHPGNGLAFLVDPEETPLALCSSSGKMGRSMSLGQCDLATVASDDAPLADAAATRAANLVSSPEDIGGALETIAAIPGVRGVLILKDGRIGLAGKLPELIRAPVRAYGVNGFNSKTHHGNRH